MKRETWVHWSISFFWDFKWVDIKSEEVEEEIYQQREDNIKKEEIVYSVYYVW